MFETENTGERAWLLPRFWAVLLLLLVAATYRLWLVPGGPSTMPRIPLIYTGIEPPGWLAIFPCVVLVIGLLLLAMHPARYRRLWWVVSGSLLASFLLDQHRLQPWAYQSAIYGLIFATMDRATARRWLIPLAASVYVYSAAGKFDYQFVHTVGQDFLQAVARPVGGLPDHLTLSARAKLALLFPVVELVLGLGLLVPVSRRFAAVLVIGMHLTLIAILGPWSLDHSLGVLMWNVLLIVQAYWLFVRRDAAELDQPSQPGLKPGSTAWLARAAVLIAVCAPLAERSGYWDHWPSWSLYSPHTSRVEIQLHRSAVSRVDPAMRPYIKDELPDAWQTLAIDQWSLESRGVAIYPQARYQLALAEAIAQRNDLDDEVRATLQGTSDRWTGRRAERRMLGRREIQAGRQQFWLNR